MISRFTVVTTCDTIVAFIKMRTRPVNDVGGNQPIHANLGVTVTACKTGDNRSNLLRILDCILTLSFIWPEKMGKQ